MFHPEQHRDMLIGWESVAIVPISKDQKNLDNYQDPIRIARS
jgi:hypothetical protein